MKEKGKLIESPQQTTWRPIVEVVRREMMARFSDKLSMEEIASCSYAIAEAESPRQPSTDVLDGSLVLTTAGVTMSIDAYNKLIQCCAGNGKGGHREDCVWAELARTKLALSELREASQHPEPAPSLGVVHERVDAVATFDSVAQGPSSPQVTPPKYDPSWHGSQAHTFVTDKPVGSEVKPRTGDKS